MPTSSMRQQMRTAGPPGRRRRIAVTGLGWYSALGPDTATTFRRLCHGDRAIRPISRWDARGYPATVAAEVLDVPDVPPIPAMPSTWLRRGTRFWMAAATEAWRQSRLARAGADLGVAVGVSVNYLHHGLLRELWRWRQQADGAMDLQRAIDEADVADLHAARRAGHLAAVAVARHLGATGPMLALDTACAASLHALGAACDAITAGRARAMVVGGASGHIYPLTVVAFGRLGALSPQRDPARASRPFDRHRDGFVLGEGGGAIVIEDWDHARERGAEILAEVAAVASTTGSGSLTDPSPGAKAEAQVMQLALDAAGIDPATIGYVAAHGTSTPKNDATESRAIERVFGPAAGTLAVSSHKGQLGHTIASAGIFNVLTGICAIREGRIPPTANYATPDPDCALDYVVSGSRTAAVRAALANAFAFGGQNACAVLLAPP